jgi:Outer membrane protein and related peptidoglycan-associated (lipo)proteins
MKRLYLIALFIIVSLAATAQENGQSRDAQNRIVRGPYETNRFFDNIFVGVAGGVNIYFGEHDSYGKFGKRMAPALDIHVGKWFTPSIGARVGYSGLQAKGWTTAGTKYAKGADGSMFKEKFGVSYLHADAMWNFSNAVSGYKETRTWNFVPFVGVGWARSYGNDTHDNEIGFDAGLLNVVRLCDLLDLTLEARCLLVNQRFDGVGGGRIGEGMLSVTAGASFNLNRRGFKRASQAQPVDYTSYLDRIKRLENTNNELASQNSELSDENEKLRNMPPKVVAEQKVSASPVALFFKIGKATLDKKELTNLEFYVRNAMKADKDKTFTLIGSADKDTGTKEINQRLSEQRMEYVYNLLKDKYGIDPSRLVKKAEGDTNNRFAEPELNRAVIVE